MVTIKDIQEKGFVVATEEILSVIYNEYCRKIIKEGYNVAKHGLQQLDEFTQEEEIRTFLPKQYEDKYLMLATVEHTKCLIISNNSYESNEEFRYSVYATLLNTDIETIKNNFNGDWSCSARDNIELMISEGGGWDRMVMLLTKYDSKFGFVRQDLGELWEFTDFEISQVFKYDLIEMKYLNGYEIIHEEGKPFVIE